MGDYEDYEDSSSDSTYEGASDEVEYYNNHNNYIEEEGEAADADLIEQEKAGADWLAAHDEAHTSDADPATGMSSLVALKQGQLSHYEPTVVKAIQDAHSGNLNGSRAGKDKLSLDAAVDNAQKHLGQSAVPVDHSFRHFTRDQAPQDLAAVLGKPVSGEHLPGLVGQVSPSLYGEYQAGQEVTFSGEFTPKPSTEVVMRAVGFLNKGDDYVDKGAGSSLPGHVLDVEGQSVATTERRDDERREMLDEQNRANVNIAKISELLIHQATKDAGGSIYANRQQAVRTALTDRFLNSAGYDGAKHVMPLPNETGITGLVPTQSLSRHYTSPYTRVGYESTDEAQEFSSLDNIAAEDRNASQVSRHGFLEKFMFQHKPSVKGTYFPLDESKDDPKDHQQRQYDQLMELVGDTRALLRKHNPSTRNETDGQIRSTGWDMAYADQEEGYNNWDEAGMLDLSMDAYSGSGAGIGDQADITGSGSQTYRPQGYRAQNAEEAMQGFGSERGGMYGDISQSEHSRYRDAKDAGANEEDAYQYAKYNIDFEDSGPVEQIPLNPLATDRERYLWNVQANKPHAQGSKEWLAQREGKITASSAKKLLARKGPAAMAEQLALAKLDPTGNLGYQKKFRGNAHTVEGNEGEELALAAFLNPKSGPGKDLLAEEAFFETNANYPGFGASPDARLYNKDGSSAGLLELKYLTPGSMENSVKNYTPQMQMQMLIAEESQTHFLALDKYTGDIVSTIVYADPEMQAQLLDVGQQSLGMANAIDDIHGVEDMRKRLKFNKPSRTSSKAGQEARFVPVAGEEETPMTAYRELTVAQQGQGAAMTVQTQGRVEESGDYMTALYKIKKADAASKDQAAKEEVRRSQSMEEAHEEAIAVNKEKNSAMRNASDAVREFSATLSNAKGGMSKWSAAVDDAAKLVREGSASIMSTERLAAEIGQSSEATRGTEWALRAGGVHKDAAKGLLMQAGSMQETFNNAGAGAKEFSRIKSEIGMSDLPEVKAAFNSISLDDLKGKTPSELINMVHILSKDMSKEGRSQFAGIFNMGDIAAYENRGGGSITQEIAVDSEGGRATNYGMEKTNRAQEILAEATNMGGTKGEVVGAAAQLNKIQSQYATTSGALAKFATAIGGATAALTKAMDPDGWLGGKALDLFMDDNPLDLGTPDRSIATDDIAPRMRRGKSKVTVNNYVQVDKDGEVTTTQEAGDGAEIDEQNGY